MSAISDLFQAAGLTSLDVAARSGIAISTITLARTTGRWPAQRRTRTALARALGLAVDPVSGLPLDPVTTPPVPVAPHVCPQES